MVTRISGPHDHDDGIDQATAAASAGAVRDHHLTRRRLLTHDGELVRLELPPRPEMLRLARQVTASVAASAGLDAEQRDSLAVAVSEACTNALEAHLQARRSEPVGVQWRPLPDGLEVTVEDRGGGFDPDALAPRPPSDHPGHLDVERGWGLSLMRALVDELAIERTPHGTRVRLVARR